MHFTCFQHILYMFDLHSLKENFVDVLHIFAIKQKENKELSKDIFRVFQHKLSCHVPSVMYRLKMVIEALFSTTA